MELFLLYENAGGFVLTHVKEWEQISQNHPEVQAACCDPSRFGQIVNFRAFHPFKNAAEALANMEAIVKGESTEVLRSFLDQNLPKKRKKVQLGVADATLGKDLSEHGFPITLDKNILELMRGCRLHHKRLIKQFDAADLLRFQVGLGHAFSRSKIQFDPNRQDKPIQQAIALVDSLDKDINLFAMRVKEWYCWHFPELGKIVTDNVKFAEVARVVGIKEQFDGVQRRNELVAIVGDEIADEIIEAMKHSMGQEIVEVDMLNIGRFAEQLIKLAQQRKTLGDYLTGKLEIVSPNLQALVGDILAARLISNSGSLVNLAKYPASTVQILGAEKALFRALKTKGNTPKYGLLFQSTFIGRAVQKNKGRVSRYLANKCSLAARIDNFSTVPSSIFGEKMRDQVESRMKFLTDRVAPRKNLDVMREAVGEYQTAVAEAEKVKRKEDKKKRRKAKEEEVTEAVTVEKDKKDKKEKKKKDKKEKTKRSKKKQAAVSDDDVEME